MNTGKGHKGHKRKDRNSSGSASDNVNRSKQSKQRGASGELDDSVSTAINQANAVLYDDSVDSNQKTVAPNDSLVFESGQASVDVAKMAEGGSDLTNRQLMEYLKSTNKSLDDRLGAMENKPGSIELIEKKVTQFEKDLSKMWMALDDRSKRSDERVSRLEDSVDTSDVGATLLTTRITDLEKERDSLRDDLTYRKSQSMRNNLVFTNIPEDSADVNETSDVTEKNLRQHLHTTLKIARETADAIRFERVHRTPGQPIPGKIRNIFAKFTLFPDRELVRKEWKHLKGTGCHMFEQFPKEVSDKRRKLVKKMKEAREKGQRAWLVYDTLYVDGKPVRD